MNKVILMGHITQVPELKTVGSTTIVTSSIAVNRRYKDKTDTMFIELVAFGKLGDIMATFLFKGSPALVCGRLEQSRWEDKDGQKRSKHRVIVEELKLLSKKDDAQTGRGDSDELVVDDGDIPF